VILGIQSFIPFVWTVGMHWEIPGAVLEASPAVVATPPGSVGTVSLSIGLLDGSAGGAALATATALLALGGTVVVWYRRTQTNGTGQTVPSTTPASTDGDAGAETRESGGRDRTAQTAEETGEDEGPAASVGQPAEEPSAVVAERRAVTTGGVTADPERPALDEDEARVLAMLDSNNGQLRQSAVVEGTDWSKSKVSLVLSEMSDRGLVTKLPVGRQNVIFRAGEEPGIVLTDDDAGRD
jgi:uncharacterized membrane protein